MLTFGVYFFWAGVNIKKFFYENTVFMGRRFEHTATGLQELLFYLRVAAFFAFISLALWGGGGLLVLLGVEKKAVFDAIPGLYMVMLVLVMPLLLVAMRRFIMNHRFWGDVSFSFHGRVASLYRVIIKGAVLMFLTFGLYFPWFYRSYLDFIVSNTRANGAAFSYTGEAPALLRRMIPVYVVVLLYILFSFVLPLLFPSLVLIFTIEVSEFLQTMQFLQLPESTQGADILFYIINPVFLLLFFPALAYSSTAVYRYNWNHIRFQNGSFKCDLPAVKYAIKVVVGGLAAMLTLGLALPWILFRLAKAAIESVYSAGDFDLEQEGDASQEDPAKTTGGALDAFAGLIE